MNLLVNCGFRSTIFSFVTGIPFRAKHNSINEFRPYATGQFTRSIVLQDKSKSEQKLQK